MQWASAVSFVPDVTAAAAELKREISRQLGQRSPDLVVAFLTPHYEEGYGKVPELIDGHFSPRAFIGCTAVGVIGAGIEVEDRAAFSVTAAVMPGVDIHPFELNGGDIPDLDAGPERWVQMLGVEAQPAPIFLLLVDPAGAAAFDPRPLLQGLDYAYGDAVVIGGLASALQGNRLYLDGVSKAGCVGLAFQGNIRVDTVVAQGCRPIGRPMTVTACSGYYLTELDDRPAVEVLVELYRELSPADRELLQRALHLGIASTELKEEFAQGDFLIRNIMQVDHERNIIAVGDLIRPGQTVQFHVRDAAAATRDLQLMLGRFEAQSSGIRPEGALLFTCTGRGQQFFDEPHHDSGRFMAAVGEIPLGGFFCGGEFGQVGGSTYLHGYTSSFGIFRPAQ